MSVSPEACRVSTGRSPLSSSKEPLVGVLPLHPRATLGPGLAYLQRYKWTVCIKQCKWLWTGVIEWVCVLCMAGTLTQNEMVFRRLHLGTVAYGMDSMDEVQSHVFSAYTQVRETKYG